jgi:hypothetical protein
MVIRLVEQIGPRRRGLFNLLGRNPCPGVPCHNTASLRQQIVLGAPDISTLCEPTGDSTGSHSASTYGSQGLVPSEPAPLDDDPRGHGGKAHQVAVSVGGVGASSWPACANQSSFTNPIMRTFADAFRVRHVVHRGRRTGREYRTPSPRSPAIRVSSPGVEVVSHLKMTARRRPMLSRRAGRGSASHGSSAGPSHSLGSNGPPMQRTTTRGPTSEL